MYNVSCNFSKFHLLIEVTSSTQSAVGGLGFNIPIYSLENPPMGGCCFLRGYPPLDPNSPPPPPLFGKKVNREERQ